MKTLDKNSEKIENKVPKVGYTIKEMLEDERPQEKLMKNGPETLANEELLALIIRTGTNDMSAIELSRKILYELQLDKSHGDILEGLRFASIDKLKNIKGIGDAKAAMIMAALTLGQRLNKRSLSNKIRITNPGIAAEYVMSEMREYTTEHFKIMILNTKKEILYIREISHGTINMTLVHPREVFKRAIEDGAHSIILLHNHPTGDPKPSHEDIKLTRNLLQGSKILQIDILDHIIIGDNIYFSFLKEGLMD